MSEVERKLAEAGVFAGHGGLEGLANSSEFWERQTYGTRLYYGAGITDYLHRDVLQAAIKVLKQPPSQLEKAAPDLLAALLGVLRVADRQTVEFDAARAAIAKATTPNEFTPNPARRIDGEIDEYVK
jgi:hypothetical protein